jgi:uncharacterized protein
MSFSLYEASTPVVIQMLTGLSGVIDKAAAYAAERKIDPRALIDARFAPDMYAFGKQTQVASMWGCFIPGKLAGVDAPKLADDEKTFEDLKARVGKAIEFARSCDAKAIDAAAETVIAFQAGPNLRKFKGKDFLMHFALPHFFFHCTTAYDLIRHSGVPLAKRDYMGPVQGLIEG